MGGILVTITYHLVLLSDPHFQQIDHGGMSREWPETWKWIVVSISLLLHSPFFFVHSPILLLGPSTVVGAQLLA